MRIIAVFKAGESARHRPAVMPATIRIDTSLSDDGPPLRVGPGCASVHAALAPQR